MKNAWTARQYTYYRAIFGAYLLVHFAQLLPWGTELFSNEGVLPHSSLSPLIYLFPNVLALWDSPPFVTYLLFTAVGLSAFFAVGLWDKGAALGLWYIWACLLGRNPLISNPSIPFVGWLLVAHLFIPSVPPIWSKRRETPWQLPARIYGAAWLVMSVGYTYSGYTKLVSKSWVDGSALSRILQNPLARIGPQHDLLLRTPPGILRLATFGALGLEISFAFLFFFRRLRPWLWASMVCLHLMLLVLVNFADLSLGMLMFHLFTFDPAWLTARHSRGRLEGRAARPASTGA